MVTSCREVVTHHLRPVVQTLEEMGPGISPLFSFWLSSFRLGLSGMEGRAVVETLGGGRCPQGQHWPKHSLGFNLYQDKTVHIVSAPDVADLRRLGQSHLLRRRQGQA